MMMSGWKSTISWTCRSVMPPDTGITVQPSCLGAVVRAEPAGEQAVAVGDVHDRRRAARRPRGWSAPSASTRSSMSSAV